MSATLQQVLSERNVDGDAIQQAMRYYLAERTGDLSPEDMREQIVNWAGDADAVDSAIRGLQSDPEMIERAALAFLSCAWEEPDEPPKIEGAIDDAKKELPVVEVGIIATMAM